MSKSLLALTLVVMVAGCVNVSDGYYDPELRAHLEAERDFHQQFSSEAYANPEFLSDCYHYKMKECYE